MIVCNVANVRWSLAERSMYVCIVGQSCRRTFNGFLVLLLDV
jgi:hypothetical protein